VARRAPKWANGQPLPTLGHFLWKFQISNGTFPHSANPETSDVISWQRVFSLHKMREVKLLFYNEGELSVLHDIKIFSDNPDNQQGGVSVTVVSTHKIHLVIFDGNNYIFFAYPLIFFLNYLKLKLKLFFFLDCINKKVYHHIMVRSDIFK
tara:strand:+ start:1826 stop:2278 length:453 start_codon:yes stop_codon:yes gene_type:complete